MKSHRWLHNHLVQQSDRLKFRQVNASEPGGGTDCLFNLELLVLRCKEEVNTAQPTKWVFLSLDG